MQHPKGCSFPGNAHHQLLQNLTGASIPAVLCPTQKGMAPLAALPLSITPSLTWDLLAPTQHVTAPCGSRGSPEG